ncbi:MAG: ADP-ribosylation factor-like protein [Promethearchaeota archaeon]
MVRRTADNKVYIKILYWGPFKAGKTTIFDTLNRLTKDQKLDIEPIGNLVKIGAITGSTLYFDRIIFRSTKQQEIFYHVYTVGGHSRFSPVRNKIFKGTDGIIFVFDSQKSQLTKNIESLKELKEITKGDLVKKIPLIIMLNKQDLSDKIDKPEAEQFLKDEGLIFESENSFIWNPVIFETVGLYHKQKNVYEAFIECTERTKLYLEEKKLTKTARINLTLTEELKNEWEIFARDVLNKSLSQMIRDAVREYRKKYIRSEEVQETIETKIEKIISEKMEKIMEKFKFRDNKAE